MAWCGESKKASALRAFALAFLIGAGGAATADAASEAALPRLDEASALRSGQAAIGRTIGDYTLLDRQGKPVRLSDYRGKPLVVSFVYTGCFQVCPANTKLLADAVKGLDRLFGPERYQVLSIGFNQPFDSPTAMRAFAAQHRIDRPNWEFLSPPADKVDALTRDFGFSFVATPAGFDHVIGVTVVDPKGRVYTQVFGDRVSAAQIGEPLKVLLGQPGAVPGSALTQVVERVRILCTVYDPETGEYRTNWGLLAELIGGTGFFATVVAYFVAEWRQRRRSASQSTGPAVPAGGGMG